MSEEHVIEYKYKKKKTNNNAKACGSRQHECRARCRITVHCVIQYPNNHLHLLCTGPSDLLQQHRVLRLGLVGIRAIECRMPTLSNFLTTCTSFQPSARLFTLSRVPLHLPLHLHLHLHNRYRIRLPQN